MFLLLIWVVAIAAALYVYFRQLYSTFSRAGIMSPPIVPLLGNMADILFRRVHLAAYAEKLYRDFPTEKFIGRYEFIKPSIVIRDLELVKKISVKDFEHFRDHHSLVDGSVDTLFGRGLFNLKGQEWKDMRSTLSPAFTSSKMKLMIPFMVEVGNQMISSLKKKIKNNGGHVDINIQDLCARFANDVIASCAFGTKVDSHNDVDNYFFTMGKRTAKLGYREMLVIFGHRAIPMVMKALDIGLFTESTKKFFRGLFLTIMKTREEKKIIRNDMIHLLMEANKGKLKHENETDASFALAEESTVVGKQSVHREWSDEDLVAQAVGFFFAGFETSSAGMAWILHEIAVNPDVQERLSQEIKDTDAKNGGNLDFKSIQDMKYLDMVFSETFRKWTPAVWSDRLCTKDYNCGKPNDKAQNDFIIRKNQRVLIPIRGFHHDPQYFPEPHKFDPERFSDENKHKINPFAYMPFGLGPRNCIGSRFTIYETKVMVYMLLQHLEISPCEKTCLPEQLDPSVLNVRMLGGHWLRFKLRD